MVGSLGQSVVSAMKSDRNTLRDDLIQRIGFSPDPFQLKAFDSIDANESVLVAAPTSSGKTLVAEYGILAALARGQTVIYTTPIKALSNQKMKDLSKWLGKENVGLLTGDNSIRGDAAVVVMTTEVLRNMIYAASDRLGDLGLVILDEVHYLQDPYRGPVWEEVIIQLPKHINLVCLSATVSNADEVSDWISAVRGYCACVVERTRPVALHDHYLLYEKGSRRLREFRTLSDGFPNPEVERYLAKAGGARQRDGRQRGSRAGRPRRAEILRHLDDRNQLPAIIFIFSRKGCEEAVRSCVDQGVTFLDGRQQRVVEAIAEEHCAGLTDEDLVLLGYHEWLEGLQCGVAAHHAGMVAPFKEAVEDCFAAGLLKTVFATETLALGVNLPARSVVIEQISRFRGEGHVALTASEYAQLTGRAGRRGIDSIGHAYTLWSPYESYQQIAELAANKDFELESSFRPTYNMAVNLMAQKNREDAIDLLQLSFAQYRSNRRVAGWMRKVDKAREKLRVSESELDANQHREPNEQRPNAIGPGQLNKSLKKIKPGSLITHNRQSGHRLLLVIGTSTRRDGTTRLRVVTTRGKTLLVTSSDFEELPEVLDQVALPKPFAPNRREFQRAASNAMKRHIIEKEISPATPNPKNNRATMGKKEAQRKASNARIDIRVLENQIRTADGGLGRTLDLIIEVLEKFDCVKGWSLRPAGQRLQRVFNESDLLIVLCIEHGCFDGLDPSSLAGLVSLLTYEHRSRVEPPAPWYPNAMLRTRAKSIDRLWSKLRVEESKRGLSVTKSPDPTLFSAVHGWAAGHSLDEVLDEDFLVAGDFVRHIKQVVDLLSQIAEVATNSETARTARQSIKALDRGVVAIATRLGENEASEVATIQAAKPT
jgi:ATP-dependent RNA helicase HelY